jgi:hypothetical protein
MVTVLGLYNKIKQLNTDKICEETISETLPGLLALNKEQLLEGKTSKGKDMPSYLSDPYFKSLKSAKAYSDWKDKITPNPKRKPGISNLFIVGTFHDSIEATLKGVKIGYEATFRGPEIESKNPDIYGLNDEKKAVYKDQYTAPTFKKKIEAATGLKLK